VTDTRANSRHNTILLTLERKFNENARVFGRGNLFTERRDNAQAYKKIAHFTGKQLPVVI
jgi:hypothetical protein